MILSNLKDWERFATLHPQMRTLFNFILSHDVNELKAGRIELDGKNLFINIDEPELRNKEEQKLEIHQKYIDVHFPISGTEIIGWKSLKDITVVPDEEFNVEKDFAFYSEPASTYFEVKPGEFVIMFPEDAHAPIIGKGHFRKLVAKILL